MKKKTSIILKLFILFITILYMSYFIYTILNNDFKVDNILIIKSSLIILNILILLITLISKYAGKITSILNIIIIIVLIGIDIYPLVNIKKEDNQKEITCTNDDISVKVLYKKNKVNKIIYTYTFDNDDMDGAQNFVNKFDTQYAAFDSIYSEIIFGDNITINLTYDIDKTDMDKLNEIYDYDLSNLDDLKSSELNNYICK